MLKFIFLHKKIITYAIVFFTAIAMVSFVKYQKSTIEQLELKVGQLEQYQSKYNTLNESFVELKKQSEQRNKRIKELNELNQKEINVSNKKTISIVSKEYKKDNVCEDANLIFNEYIKK